MNRDVCEHFNPIDLPCDKCKAETSTETPAAWQWLNTGTFRKHLPDYAEQGAWRPLYTHPHRREWQGLTEEERMDIITEWEPDHMLVTMCKAIEAKLKELNYELHQNTHSM